MASKPLTPVTIADEVGGIEILADRAIITFGSYGAQVRICLSRGAFVELSKRAFQAATVMLTEPQRSADVIALPVAKKWRA